jgi:hypothetical protein
MGGPPLGDTNVTQGNARTFEPLVLGMIELSIV